MNLFHALIFGIVEGVTEFLPISSTGHLILTAHLLGFAQNDFIKSFEIVIQLGAILSVVVLYWRSLLVNPEVLKRVITAFIPTAVLGFIFYKLIKKFLLGESVVLWSLFIGGILLILFELWHEEGKNDAEEITYISYPQAFLIGAFQSIAMIPGVSRAAATICGGLFLGIKRKTIVEFSFLLAVPTVLAATSLDLIKSAGSFSLDQFQFLLVGFTASFVMGIIAIQFLLRFIQNHRFISFGIYRIVIALVFWFFI